MALYVIDQRTKPILSHSRHPHWFCLLPLPSSPPAPTGNKFSSTLSFSHQPTPTPPSPSKIHPPSLPSPKPPSLRRRRRRLARALPLGHQARVAEQGVGPGLPPPEAFIDLGGVRAPAQRQHGLAEAPPHLLDLGLSCRVVRSFVRRGSRVLGGREGGRCVAVSQRLTRRVPRFVMGKGGKWLVFPASSFRCGWPCVSIWTMPR